MWEFLSESWTLGCSADASPAMASHTRALISPQGREAAQSLPVESGRAGGVDRVSAHRTSGKPRTPLLNCSKVVGSSGPDE